MTAPLRGRAQSVASSPRTNRTPSARARWFSAEPLRRHVAEQRRRGRTAQDLVAGAVTVRTLQRALTRQRLRSDSADRLATALGLHPSALWPDWFDGEVRL